jgi:hypothetical protein
MGMKSVNLAVRLLLELGALAALAYWGLQAGQGTAMKVLLGVGAPLLAALLWGTFVAPKAKRRLADPPRLTLELAVFGAGAAALVASGLTALAAAFALVVAVSLALMFAWGQRGA